MTLHKTNVLVSCPYCEFTQQKPSQTGENWGSGPGAWRCEECHTPLFTEEAIVLASLGASSPEDGHLLSNTVGIEWDYLRAEVGDTARTCVLYMHREGEGEDEVMAGAMANDELDWAFFSVSGGADVQLHRIELTTRARTALVERLRAIRHVL